MHLSSISFDRKKKQKDRFLLYCFDLIWMEPLLPLAIELKSNIKIFEYLFLFKYICSCFYLTNKVLNLNFLSSFLPARKESNKKYFTTILLRVFFLLSIPSFFFPFVETKALTFTMHVPKYL